MNSGPADRGGMVTSAPAGDGCLEQVMGEWAAFPHRGVIFDFNGTLSNDEPLLFRIYSELFSEYLSWEMVSGEYYARMAGRSDTEIVHLAVRERAGGDTDLAELLLARRRSRYLELVEQDPPIAPATAALVHRLAADGVALAIVTGAQRPDVEFVLAHSPIAGLITLIVTEEEVTHGKPDPEGFLAGARGLGIPPGRLIAFEDSLPGIRAAKAAGMRCVAVTGTHEAAVLAREADAVVAALGPELLGGPGRARAPLTPVRRSPQGIPGANRLTG